MKNTLLALALASAGAIAAPAISHAADATNGGFFVNGNVGQTSVDKGVYNDNDTGYAGNIGYRWAFSPAVALGVEGGYTKLGEFDPKASFTIPGLRRAEVEGWTAGVNGHFNFSPNWYVSGRAGLFRGDIKGSVVSDTPGTALYVDETSNKYYAGAGFGYDFSNNLSVGLNYDYYKVNKDGLDFNPDLVSVSAEYRF
jgi:OOP family OmpA-OmpF porin/outer membrane immunogenic protein